MDCSIFTPSFFCGRSKYKKKTTSFFWVSDDWFIANKCGETDRECAEDIFSRPTIFSEVV